jgi:hypothetical protein
MEERIIEEKKELDIKIQKLYLFMMNKEYDKLSELDRDRLVRQHIAMSQYSGVLGERINGFTS